MSLAELRGRVVAIEAFQMLCPGCVSHGLPQAQRIADTFGDDVTVLGLHTVFEHHDAMAPVSLEAFLHEYRIGFPVGIDAHDQPDGMPLTMASYQLRGTPSLILIDRAGRVRDSPGNDRLPAPGGGRCGGRAWMTLRKRRRRTSSSSGPGSCCAAGE